MLTLNSMISCWLNYCLGTITVLKSLGKINDSEAFFFFFSLGLFLHVHWDSVLNLRCNLNCSHCPKVSHHILSEFSTFFFFALHSRAALSYGTLTTVPLQANELKGLALLWSKSNLTIWTRVTFFQKLAGGDTLYTCTILSLVLKKVSYAEVQLPFSR